MKINSSFALILFIFSIKLQAYLTSITNSETQIKWNQASTSINLYVNSSNSQSISTSSLNSIASSSMAQWNHISGVSLNYGSTIGTGQEGLNELYFTNDPSVFNSSNIGVAAVTLVSYSDLDGRIVEADILVNDDFSIVTSQTNSNYIGNIFTHEMGHLLGLDHGQSIGTTMFYALSLGQSQISDDDLAGLYSIYKPSDSNRKTISGKIVGGRDLIGVFGVLVEAISQNSGKVIGSTISSRDGSFSIKSLPVNDSYFIYTKPVVKSKLPSKYSNVKTNFCSNGESFRGSFFSACGGASEGYPQAISLTSSDRNIGNVTIRCSLDVPPDYIQNKSSALYSYDLITNLSMGYGNSFVGYFSNQEINSGTFSDTFRIDLTNVLEADWNNLSTDNLYLELSVINQLFYSPFKANVSILNNSTTTTPSAKYVLGPDGWVDIDTTIRLPINKTTTSQNVFDVTITPEIMSDMVTPSGLPTSITYILPDYSNFSDSMYFYLATSKVVVSNGDGTYTPVSKRSYVVSDNSSCTDAPNTYQLSNYTTTGSSSDNKRKGAVGCGSVDLNNNDKGSGPMSFVVGLILSIIVLHIRRRFYFI